MPAFRADSARRWRIGVIDGPNMPNLGRRDRAVYGELASLAELQSIVAAFAADIGVEVEAFASNHEGEILEFIHESSRSVDAYVVNPAGLTTYGEATRHALAESGHPFVEVHFANTARTFPDLAGPGSLMESRFTRSATGLVMGLRHHGYLAALLGLVLALDDEHFLGS
jgi:3-dehydroquinate dehydratase II